MFGFDVLDRIEQAVAMVKERLKRAVAALEDAGFIHAFTFGIDIFVDGPNGKAREAVNIFFAGERVKPQELLDEPCAHPRPCDDPKHCEAETFTAPEPVVHVSRMRSSGGVSRRGRWPEPARQQTRPTRRMVPARRRPPRRDSGPRCSSPH